LFDGAAFAARGQTCQIFGILILPGAPEGTHRPRIADHLGRMDADPDGFEHVHDYW
jgi:hypothetical protein